MAIGVSRAASAALRRIRSRSGRAPFAAATMCTSAVAGTGRGRPAAEIGDGERPARGGGPRRRAGPGGAGPRRAGAANAAASGAASGAAGRRASGNGRTPAKLNTGEG